MRIRYLSAQSFKHMLEKNCRAVYTVFLESLYITEYRNPPITVYWQNLLPSFASPMIQIFVQILHLSTSLCPGYCIFSYDFTIYAVIYPRRRKWCCRPVIPSVYSLIPNRHLRFFYAYQLSVFILLQCAH